MAESHTQALLKLVDKMPPLPTTAAKIIEISNDPYSSITDMDKVISMDTVLSAKVLKLVNSAYFGLRSKITTTARAIAHLGMNSVKNLVLTAVVMKSMTDSVRKSGFDMDGFWRHSFGCSVAARLYARRLNLSVHEIEDIALAGLLHDIGKLVLINYSAVEYKKVVDLALERNVSMLAAERRILAPDIVLTVDNSEDVYSPKVGQREQPIDHCYIGNHLGMKWNLPPVLLNSVTYHHFPWDCDNEETSRAVNIVHIANAFCKACNLGFAGDKFVPKIKTETWEALKMNPSVFLTIRDEWSMGLEKALEFLEALKK